MEKVMKKGMKKTGKRSRAVKRITGLLAVLLLCGCEGEEISKTIVLSDEAAEEDKRINIKNIQEYTYEEGTLDVAWSMDAVGSICLIRAVGDDTVYQKYDMYQKTLSEEKVFEEFPVGQLMIAPGGRYIAYDLIAEEKNQRIVYETVTGKKEVLMEWEAGSEVSTMAWSGDGTKLFVWMDLADYVQEEETWNIYRYDMEEEAQARDQIQIDRRGRKWRELLPNVDGSKVFVREELYDYQELGNANISIYDTDEKGLVAEYSVLDESKGRDYILDMNTGEVRELDAGQIDIPEPIKYTQSGLFGLDGDKLLFAREPLGETVGKRILEGEYVDICICEKGDHIFLIGKEERTGYLQVTGVLLDDGEIQEYQTLYKGIYGDYVQSFIGMEDHELVIQSVGYEEEEGQWLLKATVLEY